MPADKERKEYGSHKYTGPNNTGPCEYGCGCHCEPSGESRHPAGIDPAGACPGNPVDGVKLGGDLDRDYVIEQRIADLEAIVRSLRSEVRDARSDASSERSRASYYQRTRSSGALGLGL